MPAVAPTPEILDRVHQAIRARHYSHRTEQAYVAWVKRFIDFHGKRHPAEMGEPEVNQFLTHLAVRERVAASTQNQALAALLFLYDQCCIAGWARLRASCGPASLDGCRSC